MEITPNYDLAVAKALRIFADVMDSSIQNKKAHLYQLALELEGKASPSSSYVTLVPPASVGYGWFEVNPIRKFIKKEHEGDKEFVLLQNGVYIGGKLSKNSIALIEEDVQTIRDILFGALQDLGQRDA